MARLSHLPTAIFIGVIFLRYIFVLNEIEMVHDSYGRKKRTENTVKLQV